MAVEMEPDFPMDAAACRAWFEADHRRLAALNRMRARKQGQPYILTEAVSVMAAFGGCSRVDFADISSAVAKYIDAKEME